MGKSNIHAYRLAGFNIVVDAGSGSIHCADEVAFDAICIIEREGRESAAKHIRQKYVGLDESEIVELFEAIEELRRHGRLFAEDASTAASKEVKKPAVKALCMNVSHLCNMACSYCFARSVGYARHGSLMSLETGKRAIDYLIENSNGRKRLDVDFFGGEPLMNWGVVKEIVDYAREKERECGKKFRFTLTTNGSLIDEEIVDFTTREMHNVVLSLDGRPETNDAARILLGGGASYADVVPKMKRLVEARQNKGYYIRGTYTRNNLDFLFDILHIADIGFKELSLEPVVADLDSPFRLVEEDLPILREQYELLAMEMLKRRREGRGFTFYHYKLDLKGGPCVYKRIAGCGVGAEYLAVTPRGELYPCHQFVGNSMFLMGDIWRGVQNIALQGEFTECSIYSRTKCTDCWARMYCSGGCAANAWRDSGSIKGVYELGCEIFKKRLECAIMLEVANQRGDCQ